MTNQTRLGDQPRAVYETDFVSISLALEQSLLLLTWLRQISLNERKAGFREALSLTKSYGIKYWLVDDCRLSIITQPEKEWVLTEFQDEASQTTIRRLAVVIADFYPSLMANTDFTAQGKKGYQEKGHIQHEVFPDHESALDWLLAEEENDA